MRSRNRRWLPLLVAVTGAVALLVPLAGASSAKTPTRVNTWAPAGTASVHPGVMTNSPSGQCTANFVYTDSAGNTYLGQAAHCTSTGGQTDTNGCEADSLPNGTLVEIDGAAHPGVMVYNSWNAMKAAGETNPDVCQYNDLALLRLDPADVANTNPSIPFWGGPNGVNTAGTVAGDKVYSYGNSSLRFGVTQLSPKSGTSLGTDANGWDHTVYTATPGIPGDSGSAFLDAQGRALGILSTLQVAPMPGGNGVGDVSREVAYAAAHGISGLQITNGTVAFSGGTSVLGLVKLPL